MQQSKFFTFIPLHIPLWVRRTVLLAVFNSVGHLEVMGCTAHEYFVYFYVTLRTSDNTTTEKYYIRGGADKSLARTGRKKATATKLGIYSTYSPRSSINFLARCSNFCKPLKRNSKGCPSNQVSTAAMTSASDEKWRTFGFFFSPGKRR